MSGGYKRALIGACLGQNFGLLLLLLKWVEAPPGFCIWLCMRNLVVLMIDIRRDPPFSTTIVDAFMFSVIWGPLAIIIMVPLDLCRVTIRLR